MQEEPAVLLREVQKRQDEDIATCLKENEELRACNRELAQSLQQFKQENDQLHVDNSSLLESVALFESDLGKVADRHAQLIGHVNKKQKIRYTAPYETGTRLKEECAQLRLDLNKARHKLMQLEGSRRSDSLHFIQRVSNVLVFSSYGALASLGYSPAPAVQSSPQPKQRQPHAAPAPVRVSPRCANTARGQLEEVNSDFRHLLALVQRVIGRGQADESKEINFAELLQEPLSEEPPCTQDKENQLNIQNQTPAETSKAVLPEASKAILPETHEALDRRHGNGVLERKDIAQGFKRLDIVLPANTLEMLVKMVDQDANGFVSVDELLKALSLQGLHSTFCAAGPLPRAVKPADMPRAPMLGLVPSSKGLPWRLRRREDPGASCTSMATLPLLLSFLAAGTASAQWYAETETGKALAKVRSNISTAALKLRADTVQANTFVGLGAGAYIFGEPTWENTHDFWQTLGSSAQGAAIGDILGYAFGCLVGSGVAANAKQEALRALNAKKPPAKIEAELNHIKENAALKVGDASLSELDMCGDRVLEAYGYFFQAIPVDSIGNEALKSDSLADGSSRVHHRLSDTRWGSEDVWQEDALVPWVRLFERELEAVNPMWYPSWRSPNPGTIWTSWCHARAALVSQGRSYREATAAAPVAEEEAIAAARVAQEAAAAAQVADDSSSEELIADSFMGASGSQWLGDPNPTQPTKLPPPPPPAELVLEELRTLQLQVNSLAVTGGQAGGAPDRGNEY
ncbi:hypothetical protein AK812_SmicGene3896 [Symbiodinium microadriaticum]|uniref:EF-hand domain-containing protein n=1 Tax=Symbiodinium microadriaticum TaxID=2951 RepID=A0A1Q9EXS7_SYMMI|nr:hypothetical protein AK812_SmicGene3896 [Symbiodinium microadriaticum]